MATLSSPTLQRLIGNVRGMLSQSNRNNSFWSDEDLMEYINEAVRLYFVEVTHSNEGLFTTTADLNIALDTETVALPTDCFEVKNLWKKVSNGYELLTYSNAGESYSTQGGTSSTAYFPSFHFRGNSLVLRPTPNFAETAGLKLEYIQFPETMINGGDSLTNQVSPVFKQVIEAYAVYKAKLKESLVNGVTMHEVAKGNLNDMYIAFKDAIERRAKGPTFIQPFNP
jgi:hypothetical protein